MGIVEDTSNPSVIALDYFISGLLPAISKRVKSLLPETYSAAEGYAFQIECENPSLISNKKSESLNNLDEKPEKLIKIEKVDQSLNSFKENQSNSNKSVHEKLNALAKQMANWNGQSNQNDSSAQCKSGNRANTYSRNGNSQSKPSKVYRGTCFGCNTAGHTFYDCKKITGEKRDEIRQNFHAYLAKFRAERAQEKPLNSFGETTSSQ